MTPDDDLTFASSGVAGVHYAKCGGCMCGSHFDPPPAKPDQQRGRNPKTQRIVDLHKLWEQDVREVWRALLLFLKANLEAIERKIITAERAFMAFLLTPDGRTVGDAVLPAYREALTSGRLAIEASS